MKNPPEMSRVYQGKGLAIFVVSRLAKTAKGKSRIAVQIRQTGAKAMRITHTLGYTRAADVIFERPLQGGSDT